MSRRGRARRQPIGDDAEEQRAPAVAHDVLRLQQSAGNAATASVLANVQRWTGYGLTLKGQDQLVADGIAGDTVAISQIDQSRFASIETDKRLTMIDHVNANTYVGGFDERSLRYLWQSFGPSFLAVADQNVARWRKSVARYSDLPKKVPEAKPLYESFASDTQHVAAEYLKTNGTFVKSEMERFGVEADEKALTFGPTEAQKDELRQLQDAAAGLQQLQYAQEAAQTAWVGWALSPDASTSEDDKVSMWVFVPQTYDPAAPPPQRTIPEAYFRHSSVGIKVPGAPGADAEASAPIPVKDNAELAKVAPLRDHAAIHEKYQDTEKSVAAVLNAYPELFAVGMSGSKATGAFAAADSPEKAMAAVATGLRALAKNIEKAKGDLGGALDPLDLAPIHRQLKDGTATAKSTVQWNRPLASAVADDQVKGHHIDRALRQMVLAKVQELAFLLAPLTGGASAAVAMLVGVAAAGTNFAIDERRYLALSAASKAQAKPGTSLVDRSDALAAQVTAESEGVALALALVAAGAAAPEVLKGMRAAWRQRLIDRVGQPSTVLTGTAADPLGPRNWEPPYLEPPGTQVVRPGSPLNVKGLDPSRRYLWVVDTEGNFKIASEAQGDYYAWRTRGTKVNTRSQAKHGDLVAPREGSSTRQAARAGGELVAERGPNGQPTGRWIMNNDSSYTFFRADGRPLGGANLEAARDLLAASGTDTSKIVTANTAGIDRPR